MTTVVKKVTGKKIFILAQFVKYRRFILELSSFKILFYIGLIIGRFDRPFHDCLKPLLQSDEKFEAIALKVIYYSHANETHFHKKGFALHSLVLKVRVFGTRKWLNTSYKVLCTCGAVVSLISPIGF